MRILCELIQVIAERQDGKESQETELKYLKEARYQLEKKIAEMEKEKEEKKKGITLKIWEPDAKADDNVSYLKLQDIDGDITLRIVNKNGDGIISSNLAVFKKHGHNYKLVLRKYVNPHVGIALDENKRMITLED